MVCQTLFAIFPNNNHELYKCHLLTFTLEYVKQFSDFENLEGMRDFEIEMRGDKNSRSGKELARPGVIFKLQFDYALYMAS